MKQRYGQDAARGPVVHASDPQPDAEGRLRIQIDAGPGTDAEAMREAAKACQRYLPGGEAPDPDDPEAVDARLAFAKCMREHGIDMPDPDPDETFGSASGAGAKGPGGLDPDDPKVQDAIEACAKDGAGMVLRRRTS